MGIDFSHCDARWSYSGFNRFRSRLVKYLGVREKLDAIYERPVAEWPPALRASPLMPLINHSDCDGEISVAEMTMMVDVLQAAVETIEDGYDVLHGRLLTAGMRSAIEHNEPLVFK